MALRQIVRQLRAALEDQRATGVRWLGNVAMPVAEKAVVKPGERPRADPLPQGEGMREVKSAPVAVDAGVAQADSLTALRQHIGDCQRCKLAPGRTNIVFGVGNPNADLMFIGEGPGHDEDLQGEPFVGRAGQLLTEIITKGMKLARSDVYIANVVKCRPPGNRNPEPDEVSTCIPFLARQVLLVNPRVIVLLGSVAAQAVLATKTPISRMRGVWHEYQGIKVMPTFHPAYLLRNPGDKKLVWEDVKKVMGELGLPV